MCYEVFVAVVVVVVVILYVCFSRLPVSERMNRDAGSKHDQSAHCQRTWCLRIAFFCCARSLDASTKPLAKCAKLQQWPAPVVPGSFQIFFPESICVRMCAGVRLRHYPLMTVVMLLYHCVRLCAYVCDKNYEKAF